MKKKFLCLLLGIVLCLSFVLPLYAIDGTIIADDNATLITPLEITNVPTGAAAVAHNLTTNQTYYYRINGNILPSNNNENLSEPGWMPESHSIDGVIGDDNRELVSNTQVTPFSAIAYVLLAFPDQTTSCATATMISPNVAITAAHNLYCREKGGWATTVLVCPGTYGFWNMPTMPWGGAPATEIAISIPAFEDESEADGVNCDWGVIHVSTNIGYNSGYLGFQCIALNPQNYSIMISGYPADLNDANFTTTQYMGYGFITNDASSSITATNNTSYENRILSHNVDATDGQSGSPILYTVNNQIIGIYTAGVSSSGVYYKNIGFGLKSEVFHFLLSYKSKYL